MLVTSLIPGDFPQSQAARFRTDSPALQYSGISYVFTDRCAGGGTQRLTPLLGTHKGLKIMLELQLERAEFLSAVTNPGAQKSMIAYLEQTAATGDLPLYDREAYGQAAEAGHFG